MCYSTLAHLTILQAIQDGMEAHEIEALSMLARGFVDLREANPELAYTLILDILSGINENGAVRQHVSTMRGLFPAKKVVRRGEMTSRGLVVVEQEMDDSVSNNGHAVNGVAPSNGSTKSGGSGGSGDEPARKSPIAELLYMRWLEGLKLKWPSIL